MDGPLPPNPVLTRWGTWLEAALFYANNFVEYKNAVLALQDDAVRVEKVKRVLSKEKLVKELAFIKTHTSHLPAIMTSLEARNLSLEDQLHSLNVVEENLAIVQKADRGEIL